MTSVRVEKSGLSKCLGGLIKIRLIQGARMQFVTTTSTDILYERKYFTGLSDGKKFD